MNRHRRCALSAHHAQPGAHKNKQCHHYQSSLPTRACCGYSCRMLALRKERTRFDKTRTWGRSPQERETI